MLDARNVVEALDTQRHQQRSVSIFVVRALFGAKGDENDRLPIFEKADRQRLKQLENAQVCTLVQQVLKGYII